MKSLRSLIVGSLVALTLGGALALRTSPELPEAEARQLRAAPQWHWFKGNMHTHSLWSDGDDYLESIALWYRDHDYQFLVFTDHNTLADRERWVNIDKSKGGAVAFEKLKQKFLSSKELQGDENAQREALVQKFSFVTSLLR